MKTSDIEYSIDPVMPERRNFRIGCIGAPNGKLIGKINKDDNQATIQKVKGIHNLFLVFKNEIALNNFRFIEE